jgi:hypothetical protein
MMKGLNKLALATAVAAAPFATQAMEPMSDAAMGNTTGQAGVTIELDTNLNIGQIAYSQGDATGSFLVNNTRIGGVDDASGNPTSLDLAINVDLVEQDTAAGLPTFDASGNFTGTTRTLDDGDALISLKNPANDSSEMVDVGVTVGSMGLENSGGTESATLVSNLNMDMYLSKLDIIAKTNDLNGDTGTTGSLGIDVAFAIDNLDVDFDVAAVDIRGLRMAGGGTLDTLKDETNAVDGVTDMGPPLGYQADVTPAVVSMDIGAGDASDVSMDGIDQALVINLANFQADIWMDQINIGNNTNGTSSIGSVGIRNLTVTNTDIAVYGRD